MNLVQNKIDIQQIFRTFFFLFIILILSYYSARFIESSSIFYVISAEIGILLAVFVFLKEEYGIIPLIILLFFPHLIAKNMYGIKALNSFNLIFLAILAKIFLNLIHAKKVWIPKVSFLFPLLFFLILELVSQTRAFLIYKRLPLDLDNFLTYFLKPIQFSLILFIILFSLKKEVTIKRILVFLAISSGLISFYYLIFINRYLGHVTGYLQIIKAQYDLGGIQGIAFGIGSLLPALLVLFYYIKTKWMKTIIMSSFIINTYFIFYSFARTIYLSLFFSLLYVVYKVDKKKLIPFFLCVAIFLSLAPNMAINRILYGRGNYFKSINEYGTGRIDNLRAASAYIGDNFLEIVLFGAGEGAFESESTDYIGTIGKDTTNMYISLFIRSGILGIIIFVWMVFGIFKESNFLLKNSDNELIKVISLGVNAVMIQFLLQGLFTDFRLFERGKLFLLVLLGFLVWFKRQYIASRLNKSKTQKNVVNISNKTIISNQCRSPSRK